MTPSPEEQNQHQTNALQMAYLGLRERIADRRMERAGEQMEQMDHKIALYSDLHGEQTGDTDNAPHETATGEPAVPRNIAEKLFSKYVSVDPIRKAEAKRVEKVYGGTDGRPKSAIPILSKRRAKVAHEETIRKIRKYQDNILAERPELSDQPGDSQAVKDQKKRDRARVFNVHSNGGALSAIQQEGRSKTATKTLEQKRFSSDNPNVKRLERRRSRAIKHRDKAIGRIQESHQRSEEFRRGQAELIDTDDTTDTTT
ncbi:hypothetical protein BH23PAT2_BH23PAT2_05690 [soil metagenome]